MSENFDVDMELDEFLAGLDEKIGDDKPTPEKEPEPAPEQAPEPEQMPAEPEPESKPEPVAKPAAQPEATMQNTHTQTEPQKPNVINYKDGTVLKSYVDADELKRDVTISPTDLDNDMIRHSALYVHYAAQTVNARHQYDRTKRAAEVLEAQLDAAYRARANDEGKKTTEAQLKNQIAGDPRYVEMQQKLIDAHSIWKLADVAENAFLQRKDLLLEVARDRRKEKEGNLRVMELEAAKKGFLDNARESAKAA